MGYSAPDIYHRIRGGSGHGPLSDNERMMGTQATSQSDLTQQVQQLTNKMNSAWTGDASAQAVTGAAPVAASAD